MLCDDACTDCDDTGLTKQTERYCSCQAGFDLRASEGDPDLLPTMEPSDCPRKERT